MGSSQKSINRGEWIISSSKKKQRFLGIQENKDPHDIRNNHVLSSQQVAQTLNIS